MGSGVGSEGVGLGVNNRHSHRPVAPCRLSRRG